MKMNEWGGCLYQCRGDMLEAMVEHWLTGGGNNPEPEFGDQDDDEIATDMVEAWQLDGGDDEFDVEADEDDEVEESHMGLNMYDVDDLAERVAVVRARQAKD